MPQPFALLACDVFEKEIEAFAQNGTPWSAYRVLKMGLHDRPDHLRAELQRTLAEFDASAEIEAIALAYGRCGNGLIGLTAGRVPLILPQAHDCISILLGGTEPHDALLRQNPGSYFYSPGWVRGKRVPGPDRETHIRASYANRFADDPEMIDDLVEVDREMFAHHDCATYVSIIHAPEAHAYCRRCAHHLGWRHREAKSDPSFLHALLAGQWDNPERFLRVEPGQRVAAGVDGRLRAESDER